MKDQNAYGQMPRTPGAVIGALWRNWAISYGALTLPMVLAFFIPRVTIPFILLIEAYLLAAYSRAKGRLALGSCAHILIVARRTLAISGLIMIGILVLYTDRVIPTVFRIETFNADIPFIICLVMAPVQIVLSALRLLLGEKSSRCRRCKERHKAYAPDTAIVHIYFRESRYQLQILLAISVVLGAIEYWYYFARYINVNLNPQDLFIFNLLPLVAFLLSIFFLGGRYATIEHLYESMYGHPTETKRSTRVRFLVFSGNELMVALQPNGRWDTPFRQTIGFTDHLGDHRAAVMFSDATAISSPTVKYLFTNATFATENNVIHYAVFLNGEQRESLGPEKMWFTAYMIDQALSTRALEPLLAQELYRIHTITLAWKTYDREGHRLYPIRHYRPTFRLSDLPSWTVDYDDDHWVFVSRFNQDRSFFRLRKAWMKFTSIFPKAH